MNYLSIISDKHQWQVWLRAFRIWQCRPPVLKPLSEAEHTCHSCGTAFQGNFCPRCGQSAQIERFSFKKAFLLFLDVWGLGNRGMFRSIRDLALRPGYMIRDYIGGMQTAYFPPFKMFFLLTALGLLVEHGLNFSIEEEEAPVEQTVKVDMNGITEDVMKDVKTDVKHAEDLKPEANPIFQAGMKFVKTMDMLRQKNPAIFAFLSLILFTVPLYFFFRQAPAIPDLRYSEFVVMLVYTSNMYSIYTIAGNLLDSRLLAFLAVLMVFVALKQFSGFSKRRVLGYIVLTIIISIAVAAAIMAAWIYCIYLMTSRV